MLRRIQEQFQLDRTLGFAIASRAWQFVAGPITIILLIRAFTLSEQGVYYAMVAIVGVQAYFELGLLNVLVSHSGHEIARVRQAEIHGGEALTTARGRMGELINASFRWFGFASIAYVFCAMGFGWFTLSDSNVPWQWPITALIPIAAISIWLAPALSILEGAGHRDLIYRYRFIQMVIGSAVVWLSLLMGWKLWALVLSALVQALVAVYVTYYDRAEFFARFRQTKEKDSGFVWVTEVLPAQWRMALISASFHLATQFFVIIIVKFHSDAEAGPLGMTLSITGAIQMVAAAWVQTKYPLISNQHGEGRREEAAAVWKHTAIVSTSLLILGCLTLVLLISALPWLDRGLERNFIAPYQVLLLSLGCLAGHITSIQAFYVLARRANPLLVATMIGTLSTAALVWAGGYFYATTGVISGYAIGMTFVLFPVHTWAYLRFRQRT